MDLNTKMLIDTVISAIDALVSSGRDELTAEQKAIIQSIRNKFQSIRY